MTVPVTGRLAAYLARIGLAAAPAADAAGLAAVQQAHRQAITFENIDVLLGRPILIDSDGAFAKLVERGRGGYCFEQNRVYADMLAAMGFATRPLLARPRLATPAGTVPPRTHVLLLADIDGQPWIADAGFGGTYVPPMPLADGAEVLTEDGARHRLRRVRLPDGEWLLERAGPRATTDGRALDNAEWQGQYSFDLAEVAQADLDQANHWTATWPGSRFLGGPIVSRVTPGGFIALSGTALTLGTGEHAERSTIANPDEWRDALHRLFGLKLVSEEVSALELFS